MTNKKIADALGITERHARRLRAAHDPRVEALLKCPPPADTAHELSPEQLAQLERDLCAEYATLDNQGLAVELSSQGSTVERPKPGKGTGSARKGRSAKNLRTEPGPLPAKPAKDSGKRGQAASDNRVHALKRKRTRSRLPRRSRVADGPSGQVHGS